MSKRASVSKRRGQPTRTLGGARVHPVRLSLEGDLASGPTSADALPPRTPDASEAAGADSCLELLQTLRRWESELRQNETRLQQKEQDLAARRRQFAQELRAQRRQAADRDSRDDARDSQADGVLTTPLANADVRLIEMQSQIAELVSLLREAWPSSDSAPDCDPTAGATAVDEYLSEIGLLKGQIESLVEQNTQLASELAHVAVQRTVDQSSDAAATMSWEERKELLFRQFESEDNGVPFNPAELTSDQCSRLNHEMACMQQELRAREQEVAELRTLLEQRPTVQDSELAVGAAAITRMFDDDEIIREERNRLKEVQAEWEAKFRDMEIAASIERASLARERRQLECQNAELEEQLAHLKQELKQELIAGPAQPRRWLAKLGLGE